MKAIELAKKLYPDLSKGDIKYNTCPDILHIFDNGLCQKDKKCFEGECEDCWNREVDDKRVEWLLEAKKMCKLLGCD